MRCLIAACVLLLASIAEAQAPPTVQKVYLWGPGTAWRPIKWGMPTLGTGARVTYGFVRKEQNFPPGYAITCVRMSPTAAFLRDIGVDFSDFERLVDHAFGEWSTIANIQFVRAAPGVKPEILIGGELPLHEDEHPGIWGFGNPVPSVTAGNAHVITKSAICLKRRAPWPQNVAERLNTLYALMRHEIGHAIGLSHAGSAGAVMSESLVLGIDFAKSDIDAAVFLYGPPKRR